MRSPVTFVRWCILITALWFPATSRAVAKGDPGSLQPPTGTSGAITEQEAVTLSLRQGPLLAEARHTRNLALLEAERARPKFRPDITFSAMQGFNVGTTGIREHGDDLLGPDVVSRAEIALRLQLLQIGAGESPRVRAAAMEAAARSSHRAAELDSELGAREAFLAAIRVHSLVRVAERAAELTKENLRVTRDLLEHGLKAEVDVLDARRDDAEAESRLIQTRNGEIAANANLNRVMGRPLDTPVQPVVGELTPESIGLDELLRRAQDHRPELNSIRQSITAAEAGVRLAKISGLPRIDLQGTYAIANRASLTPRGDAGPGFLVEPRNFGSIGITLTAPLFEQRLRTLDVREAQERLEQAREGLKALQEGVALEVRTHFMGYSEARARTEVAKRGIAAAEKAAAITRARMELGRATQLEVMNSIAALERVLSDLAQAEYDQRLSWARLQRAVGGAR